MLLAKQNKLLVIDNLCKAGKQATTTKFYFPWQWSTVSFLKLNTNCLQFSECKVCWRK